MSCHISSSRGSVIGILCRFGKEYRDIINQFGAYCEQELIKRQYQIVSPHQDVFEEGISISDICHVTFHHHAGQSLVYYVDLGKNS